MVFKFLTTVKVCSSTYLCDFTFICASIYVHRCNFLRVLYLHTLLVHPQPSSPGQKPVRRDCSASATAEHWRQGWGGRLCRPTQPH